MKKNANEIFMLQYQIKRYQAMGNGTMCQTLNGKLQKLLAKQSPCKKTPLNTMNKGQGTFQFSALFLFYPSILMVSTNNKLTLHPYLPTVNRNSL